MLTLFRRIRKGLLEGGATSKYLLYAIGEIALVVIGILIALQINNWNEWRKDRVKETKVLEQIAKTLQTNSDHFTSAVKSMKRNNERTEAVISIIEDKRPYEESMNELFHSVRVKRRVTFTTAGYEELKNTGFDLIRTDSLKEGIVNLFESTYSETEEIIDEIAAYGVHFRKYIVDNFLEIEPTMLKPVKYDLIINDHFYYSSLLHIRSIRDWRIQLLEKSIDENDTILQLIKDELDENTD